MMYTGSQVDNAERKIDNKGDKPDSGSKAPKEQLKRSISLFQATMYGTGLILGAGIYVLIGDAAGIAGNAIWISFIIAAIIASFTGLSYAELSSTFPRSAAEYFFTKNAFRNNFVAFIVGCLIVFVALVSAAAVAIGFSGYISSFFPQLNVPPVAYAIGLVAVLSFANFYGISESMWMNVAFTLIELVGLAIIIVAGFTLGSPEQIDYFEIPGATATDGSTLMAMPLLAVVLSAAGLIFFSYFGFENMANIAEETKNPSKAIPRALLLSIIITTAAYVLVAISSLSLVDWSELSASDAPLATAAGSAFGRSGSAMLGIIALFATSNTVLMMLISGSRIIFGIAKDGAFPSILARIHSRRRTPWIVVVVAMVVAGVTIALSSESISAVASISVFGIFIVYAFVNLSLIVLRYKQPALQRPFVSPIKIGKFPVLAGLGLVTSIAMLSQFSFTTAIAGMSVIAASMMLYGISSKMSDRVRQ